MRPGMGGRDNPCCADQLGRHFIQNSFKSTRMLPSPISSHQRWDQSHSAGDSRTVEDRSGFCKRLTRGERPGQPMLCRLIGPARYPRFSRSTRMLSSPFSSHQRSYQSHPAAATQRQLRTALYSPKDPPELGGPGPSMTCRLIGPSLHAAIRSIYQMASSFRSHQRWIVPAWC